MIKETSFIFRVLLSSFPYHQRPTKDIEYYQIRLLLWKMQTLDFTAVSTSFVSVSSSSLFLPLHLLFSSPPSFQKYLLLIFLDTQSQSMSLLG